MIRAERYKQLDGTKTKRSDSKKQHLEPLLVLTSWASVVMWHVCSSAAREASPALWLAVVSSTDRRERPIGRFHEVRSRVLQPMSERHSGVIAHLSYLQEETHPPDVPPTLHLTSSRWHHQDDTAQLLPFLGGTDINTDINKAFVAETFFFLKLKITLKKHFT